jgi:bifunctional pyridoxal-dependent enzyme with beta-cystathionase and maltose regulon repressor activities
MCNAIIKTPLGPAEICGDSAGVSSVKILEEDANVALDHGNWFGENGAGFERFNIACPRSILIKAAESVVSAIRKNIGNHDGHN